MVKWQDILGVPMLIDLESEFPTGAPNPPPWRIEYLNDDTEEPTKVLPLARTIGLERLGLPNLLIRLAPPNVASAVLDRIGIFLAFEKRMITGEDTLRFAGVDFALMPELEGGLPTLRLAWTRDQEKVTKGKTKRFNKACETHGFRFRF